ncbi:S16 family serine protease [Acidithrix ferrooxidans]|uniref:Lon protease n=1 Tax=Acidithrix ferrooxidans TaxID=1280514 RepID=A0A0D8HDG6_9ACTN|nr:S16 family serine protease [Acidithrix ferrooxidans]KJF16000.1 Lon protease [Acidithrix ferrooxidans]
MKNQLRVVGVIALVLSVILVVGFLPISSYSFSPGNAIAVANQIHIAAEPDLNKQGKVLMTDVILTQLTPITWLFDHFDSTISIYPAADIFGASNPSNLATQQLGQMIDSKTAAVVAALSFAHIKYSTILGASVVATTPKTTPSILPGDLIVGVNGQKETTLSGVVSAIVASGKKVKLTMVRASTQVGNPNTLTVVGVKYKASGRQILGISLQAGEAVKLQRPVTISTGQIGGPSAGLAFTLGVLQAMGVLHIKAGGVIAATGTIDPTGAVGDVGGVRQKTIAVARAGAKVFLVPPQEVAAAKSDHIAGLKIVPVATLAQALHYLSVASLATVAR